MVSGSISVELGVFIGDGVGFVGGRVLFFLPRVEHYIPVGGLVVVPSKAADQVHGSLQKKPQPVTMGMGNRLGK